MIFPITFLMETFTTKFTNLKKEKEMIFGAYWNRHLTHGLKFWWIRMCVFNVDERLNAFPQIRQACGFSVVWIILWRQSVDACRKPFPHTFQTNGRIPVCTGICRTKLYWAVNTWREKKTMEIEIKNYFIFTFPHCVHG